MSLAAACRLFVPRGQAVRRELRVSTTTHPKTARRGPVGPVAFASLRDAVGVVRVLVRDLEPGRVGARDAKGLIELFGEMTRLCGGGVTLLAPPVADTKVWADDAARTPAEWMSRVTGAPIGQTIGMLPRDRRPRDPPHHPHHRRRHQLPRDRSPHLRPPPRPHHPQALPTPRLTPEGLAAHTPRPDTTPRHGMRQDPSQRAAEASAVSDNLCLQPSAFRNAALPLHIGQSVLLGRATL